MSSKFNTFDNTIWLLDTKLKAEYTIQVYENEKHIILESDEEGANQDFTLAIRFDRGGKYIGKSIV